MPYAFAHASDKLSARYILKRASSTQISSRGNLRIGQAGQHDGNHAPRPHEWFTGDDTLDRQGPDQNKRRAHGICKGVASSWVIAFLNGVTESTDPNLYEQYYCNFLRFQATMIKDFGAHLDTHVAELSNNNVDPNIKAVHDNKSIIQFTERDIPDGKWAAYISVWGHDIACGGKWGSGSTLYINEPNTGLLGYGGRNGLQSFLADLNGYIQRRRMDKTGNPVAPAKFWIYQPK